MHLSAGHQAVQGVVEHVGADVVETLKRGFPSTKGAFWCCGLLHCSEDKGMHPKCRQSGFHREYSPLTVGAYWVEDSGLHLSCSKCSHNFCPVNRLDVHGHSLFQQEIWLLGRRCWLHWCFRGVRPKVSSFRGSANKSNGLQLFFSPKTYLASTKWVLSALVLQRGHLLLPPVSSQLPKPEQFMSTTIKTSLHPKGRDSL